MLKLNGIPEDRARDYTEFTRDLLQQVLSEPASKDERGQQSFHERAGRLSLTLGLLLYALEADAEEVRRLFRNAARHLVPALSLRQRPDPGIHWSPWEAEQFINVIVCFGEAADMKVIALLKPWQYRNPVHPEHDGLERYLAILLRYAGGAGVDADALAKVAKACETPSTTKDNHLFLLPATRGLASLAGEDEDNWNYAIVQLLSAHGREARRGDLKFLPDGFISFRALMLAKVGMDQDMECRADSEYLPLFLFEGREPA